MPRVPSSRRPGFTLIEIAIAVTIIAVLASVTLLGMSRVRADTEYQQCRANLEAIKLNVENYKGASEFYPTLLTQALDAAYGMRALPRCPSAPATFTGNTYGYVQATGFEGYEYIIYCNGYHQNKSIAAGFPQYSSSSRAISP